MLLAGPFTHLGGKGTPGLVRVILEEGVHCRVAAAAAGNEVTFTFTGLAGRTYILESSNDLVEWNLFSTVIFTSPTYELRTKAGGGSQFFRARQAAAQ
jgi:hypothetical protein